MQALLEYIQSKGFGAVADIPSEETRIKRIRISKGSAHFDWYISDVALLHEDECKCMADMRMQIVEKRATMKEP